MGTLPPDKLGFLYPKISPEVALEPFIQLTWTGRSLVPKQMGPPWLFRLEEILVFGLQAPLVLTNLTLRRWIKVPSFPPLLAARQNAHVLLLGTPIHFASLILCPLELPTPMDGEGAMLRVEVGPPYRWKLGI